MSTGASLLILLEGRGSYEVSPFVGDLSVQLIRCYKEQVYIDIQDKGTSVIAIVPIR